ncbi:hypothetical protein AB3F22_04120 [Actinomyces johnsonii]|jgi:hypothetical protein|uniref:hypothetical protein n=1 Tax=Actinomyces johnsonii TaxID=544581 RepID=UPI0004218247|nr:hypothetical protein [Actinomyces johnsonii]
MPSRVLLFDDASIRILYKRMVERIKLKLLELLSSHKLLLLRVSKGTRREELQHPNGRADPSHGTASAGT